MWPDKWQLLLLHSGSLLQVLGAFAKITPLHNPGKFGAPASFWNEAGPQAWPVP